MPNSRVHDHLLANKFKIEIEGVTQASFSAVSGMESSTEVIHYVDGDDLRVRKRPGRTTFSNIILTQGVINTTDLWEWYKQVMNGKIERKAGSIIVLGDDGSEKYRYNFFEAWPCRWKSLVLDARTQATLVEELELAVELIERG
jgi:phage tail-like protein